MIDNNWYTEAIERMTDDELVRWRELEQFMCKPAIDWATEDFDRAREWAVEGAEIWSIIADLRSRAGEMTYDEREAKMQLLMDSEHPEARHFVMWLFECIGDAMGRAMRGESSILDSDEWTPMDDMLAFFAPHIHTDE